MRGAPTVTVFIQKPPERPCERAGRVHARNTFRVRVNRISGDVTPMCQDPGCQDSDYPWSERHTPETLGADPLYRTLVASGISNHAELAAILAPLVRQLVAYDAASKGGWRLYSPPLGTWILCNTDAQVKWEANRVLVAEMDRLLAVLRIHLCELPRKSDVRKEARYLQDRLQSLRSDCGYGPFLRDFLPLLQAHVLVGNDQWRSHFAGYLPVRNVLLQFCLEGGTVTPLAYRPDLFVRHEYQSQFLVWDPAAPAHEATEAILNEWWDAEERASNMQMYAYALSRHCFLEKIFFLWGPPSSAKSSAFGTLSGWFGSANIFMHTSPALIVQKNEYATARDDDGRGHDSALMACFDKALVAFPEPALGSAVLRDDVIKRMTGDIQAGRRAYSGVVESVPRTYTPIVPCNGLPKPANSADRAMSRRITVVTSHTCFYSDDKHRDDMKSHMTPDQLAVAKFQPVDATKLKHIQQNPAAATYFLTLLAEAWHTLVVDRKRCFTPAPLAQKVLDRYWTDVRRDQDSVTAFLTTQISMEHPGAVMPKRNLWVAYNAWYAHEIRVNVAPGPLAKSEDAFKKRVKAFYEQNILADTQVAAPLLHVRLDDPTKVAYGPAQPKIHCYKGLSFRPGNDFIDPPQESTKK